MAPVAPGRHVEDGKGERGRPWTGRSRRAPLSATTRKCSRRWPESTAPSCPQPAAVHPSSLPHIYVHRILHSSNKATTGLVLRAACQLAGDWRRKAGGSWRLSEQDHIGFAPCLCTASILTHPHPPHHQPHALYRTQNQRGATEMHMGGSRSGSDMRQAPCAKRHAPRSPSSRRHFSSLSHFHAPHVAAHADQRCAHARAAVDTQPERTFAQEHAERAQKGAATSSNLDTLSGCETMPSSFKPAPARMHPCPDTCTAVSLQNTHPARHSAQRRQRAHKLQSGAETKRLEPVAEFSVGYPLDLLREQLGVKSLPLFPAPNIHPHRYRRHAGALCFSCQRCANLHPHAIRKVL